MMLVHHLNNSRSQRLLWLLEELELPYAIEAHTRDPRTTLAPPSLRAVHPLGKSPVLVHDNLVLAETAAIFDYVLAAFGSGRLVPVSGTPEHRRYVYWMHYAEGSAMQPLVLKVIFDAIESGPVPFFIRPVTRGLARALKAKLVNPEIERHLDFLESELSGRTWFAGDEMTAADIMMSFPLQAAAARAGLDAGRPNLMAFLARIEARPAWRKGIERGGSYQL